MEQRNEPSTGEIVRALKYCSSTSCAKACPRFYTTSDGVKCAQTLMKDAATTITALTARAESAEALAKERGEKLFEADAKTLLLEAQVSDERSLRESAEAEREENKKE